MIIHQEDSFKRNPILLYGVLILIHFLQQFIYCKRKTFLFPLNCL